MARLRSLCKKGTLAKDRAKKRKNYSQEVTALRVVLREAQVCASGIRIRRPRREDYSDTLISTGRRWRSNL